MVSNVRQRRHVDVMLPQNVSRSPVRAQNGPGHVTITIFRRACIARSPAWPACRLFFNCRQPRARVVIAVTSPSAVTRAWPTPNAAADDDFPTPPQKCKMPNTGQATADSLRLPPCHACRPSNAQSHAFLFATCHCLSPTHCRHAKCAAKSQMPCHNAFCFYLCPQS